MNIVPLGTRVLLDKLVKENTTASGIVLPNSAVQGDTQYRVKAIGPDVLTVAKGDVVVIPQHSGADVGGYVVLEENLILVKYE